MRLNSRNLRILELNNSNFNLKSSDGRSSKTISNDTKLGPISWELVIENLFFNFCVGVWVGGYPRENFSHDCMISSIYFRKNLHSIFRHDRCAIILHVDFHCCPCYCQPDYNSVNASWFCITGEMFAMLNFTMK